MLVNLPPYAESGAEPVFTDPYNKFVKSLMHMEAPQGPTVFVDERPRVWNRVSNYAIQDGTYPPKFGVACVRFSANSYIYAASDDFVIGSNDFTIEIWARFQTLGGGGIDRGIFQICNGAAGVQNTVVDTIGLASRTPDGKMSVLAGNRANLSNYVPRGGQWIHFAIVREGTVGKLFADGNVIATYEDSAFYSGRALAIGTYKAASFYMTGVLDEFRLTIGKARYSAPFVPPTEPFSIN